MTYEDQIHDVLDATLDDYLDDNNLDPWELLDLLSRAVPLAMELMADAELPGREKREAVINAALSWVDKNPPQLGGWMGWILSFVFDALRSKWLRRIMGGMIDRYYDAWVGDFRFGDTDKRS